TDLLLTLKGQYITSANTFPELAYNMKIRDGYIEYDGAPFPASNLYMDLETKLPELDPEKLSVKLDSLYFNIDKDYFGATINSTGLSAPRINARVHASMDLEKLDKAFGFQNIDLKGKCELHCKAEGLYATGPNPTSIRHENILQSIPAFKLDADVKD